jgi:hypothetical protein
VGTAALFRERLAYTLNSEAHDLLEQEWAAMKGYLHIEKVPTRGMPPACRLAPGYWEYDKNDPDEDFAVERLRRVYVLTDAKGCVMQFSTIYQSIGIEQPKEIEAAIRSGQPVWKRRRQPAWHPVFDPRRRGLRRQASQPVLRGRRPPHGRKRQDPAALHLDVRRA